MDNIAQILELSSDDDVAFDDSSTADNFDWISKLLEDDPPPPEVNNGDYHLNDVVFLGPKPKKMKTSMPICSSFDDDDDDDCVVLDGDPDKVEEKKGCDGDDDELVIVGEKGQVACRDFPHSRHLCAKFPFSSTPHESQCDLCHCYVCDSVAPCAFWGSGLSSVDHCHATDKEEFWQLERKKVRQLKNTPGPFAKPPAAAVAKLPRVQHIFARTYQALRTAPACELPSSFGVPNIISQRRCRAPSIPVATSRYQPHLVSHQLLRTCNNNTQSSRSSNLDPSLASSCSAFKRSHFSARPVLVNRSVYGSPNIVHVGDSQQLLNQQLAGKPFENNSISSTMSSPLMNMNVGSSQPTPGCISVGGLPSQFPGYSPLNLLHFQGSGVPAAVTSDNLYVYSVNQTQNVFNPSFFSNSTNPLNSFMHCNQQPSVVAQNDSTPIFAYGTNVPSSITEQIQQPSEETQKFSGSSFACHASKSFDSVGQSYQQPSTENSQVQSAMLELSDSLNCIAQSCQQPSADNFQGVAPVHELLPSVEPNPQFSGSTNSSTLDFDIESWLSDTDVNNQPSVAAPVDAGMLYFDFETSWKGLTHS